MFLSLDLQLLFTFARTQPVDTVSVSLRENTSARNPMILWSWMDHSHGAADGGSKRRLAEIEWLPDEAAYFVDSRKNGGRGRAGARWHCF